MAVDEQKRGDARSSPGLGPHPRGLSTEHLDRDHARMRDRKSTRLNSSHDQISYAVFCLKKKNRIQRSDTHHGVSRISGDIHMDIATLLSLAYSIRQLVLLRADLVLSGHPGSCHMLRLYS